MHPTAVIKITTLILAILYAEYTLPSYLFSADAYAITSAAHLQIRNYTFSFDEYINEYGKWYSNDDEYEMRRSLFEQRLEAVRVHNEDPVLSLQWRKGINQFSDRTDLELQMFRGYDRPLGHYLRSRDSSRLNEDHDRVPISDLKRLEMLPREVDWRKVPGVLTAVKEQGNCGSCWAFAAVETIESRWFLSTGKIMDLSVQGIVSCAPNVHKCGGSGGCNGGTAELAFDYVMHSGGLPSEWSNGYLQFYNNVTTKCPPVKQGDPRAMVGSYKRVSSNDMLAVMEALQSGPVAAVVDASTWHSYESGIYTGCDPNNVVLDHVVELVGYGEDIQSDGSVHPFWVIRNSWGPDVGENGFFRIAREKSTPVCGIDYKPQDGSDCEGGPDQVKVCGTCGILYDVSYPDVVF